MNLPKNTFLRYMIIGSVNLILFYGLYELFYRILFNLPYGASYAWSSAWILGSLVAHWTHRTWTFTTSEKIRWTVAVALAVYAAGLIGSTACFTIGTEIFNVNHRIVWVFNTILWGFLDYLGLKEIAFKHK